MEITRDFTVSVSIVYKGKALLHKHKKLNMWLPVGGHIDPHELPDEAAIREAKEEAGLDVELFWENKKGLDCKDVKELTQPVAILLENISGNHQHIDFTYYARAKTNNLRPEDGEATEMEWFTAEEVANLDAPEDVKKLATEAIKLLAN